MGVYAHQLKGDDHARQVLQQQVTRFPGIPYSVTAEPVSDIHAIEVPALPSLSTGELPAPVNGQPIYEPVPIADVPAIEAVPTVEIPPEAPQWLGYYVRLLQAGWQVRDAAKEVGYDKTRCWRVCKEWLGRSPDQIRLDALWARARYLRDHKFSLKETARITGFAEDSISRKLTRFGPRDRSARSGRHGRCAVVRATRTFCGTGLGPTRTIVRSATCRAGRSRRLKH